MTIIKLDENLVEKIAAGEIVERPVSVVKELIENSIDAQSKKIQIDLEAAGKKRITVEDDGYGMEKEDAKLALMRHATSKIKNLDDLDCVRSLGFRGEALPSILAVSRLILETKTKDMTEGIRIIGEGGKITKQESIGMSVSTKINVRDLFYNVPARKKFLKSNAAEMKHITDIVSRYALMYPNVSFKLIHNKKEVINAPKTDSFLENISCVYGREATKELIEVNFRRYNIKISGYVSKPALNRSTRGHQSIFVNGRFIKNKLINNAIKKAYQGKIMHSRFPIVVLKIEIDPKSVDVNVHPKKTEIRFSDEKFVYKNIIMAIEDALSSESLVPSVSSDDLVSDEKVDHLIGKVKRDTKLKQIEFEAPKEENIVPDEKLPDLEIKCQVLGTYIIAEAQNVVYIVDQHAADERYYYEKITKKYKEKSAKSQNLVENITLEPNKSDFNFIMDNISFFEDVGFRIESFGKNTVLIRAVPNIFGKIADKNFLMDLVDEMSKLDKKDKDEVIKDNIIKIMACRTAIKANDKLSAREMLNLVERVSSTENPYNCPHGRPTIIKMGKKEFEKSFKRIV